MDTASRSYYIIHVLFEKNTEQCIKLRDHDNWEIDNIPFRILHI